MLAHARHVRLAGLGFKGCYPDQVLRLASSNLRRLQIRNCAIWPQVAIEDLSRLEQLSIEDSDLDIQAKPALNGVVDLHLKGRSIWLA